MSIMVIIADTSKFLPCIRGFPGDSVVKNPPANVGDAGLNPTLGGPPEKGNGNQLQYSCLGNPMHRGVWWAKVYVAAKELDTT